MKCNFWYSIVCIVYSVYSIAVMFNGLEDIVTWESNTSNPQKF